VASAGTIRAHKLHDCSEIGSDYPPSCKYGRKLRKTAQPIIEANVPHCNFIKLNRCRHCIGAAKMCSISPGPELPETVFGSGKRQSMPILGKKPWETRLGSHSTWSALDFLEIFSLILYFETSFCLRGNLLTLIFTFCLTPATVSGKLDGTCRPLVLNIHDSELSGTSTAHCSILHKLAVYPKTSRSFACPMLVNPTRSLASCWNSKWSLPG